MHTRTHACMHACTHTHAHLLEAVLILYIKFMNCTILMEMKEMKCSCLLLHAILFMSVTVRAFCECAGNQ